MRPQAELGKGLVQEVSIVIHTLEFRRIKLHARSRFILASHLFKQHFNVMGCIFESSISLISLLSAHLLRASERL